MSNITKLEDKQEDALYQTEIEPKVALLKHLAEHLDRFVIYQKNNLISAILRNLEEEGRKSQDLTRIILRIVIDYLDWNETRGGLDQGTVDTMQRAINSVLKIQRFEFSRFNRLVDKHKRMTAKLAITSGEEGQKKEIPNELQLKEQLAKDTRSINIIIAKQNQIFHMCLEQLYRGEGYEEAFQKNITKLIVCLIDRNDDGLLRATFGMLDKISGQVDISQELKEEHMALRLARFFEKQTYLYPYYLLANVFMYDALSDEEVNLILPKLCSNINEKNIRENTCSQLSLLSCNTACKDKLFELEYDLAIFNMLINVCKARLQKGQNQFTKSPFQRALFNIIQNLTNEEKIADNFITQSSFKQIIKLCVDTNDIGLLKIINNVTYFATSSKTKMMEKFVPFFRDMLKNIWEEGDAAKLQHLSEVVSILGNCHLEEKWKPFLDEEYLMLLQQLVSNSDDHQRLQTIQLVARLCTEKRSANLMMKHQQINLIMLENNENPYNREESFQKLYLVYQLAMNDINLAPIYPDTLYQIDSFIENEFRERNMKVVSFLNELMTVLQVKFRTPELEGLFYKRFHLFNFEWERTCKIEEWRQEMENMEDQQYEMMYGDIGLGAQGGGGGVVQQQMAGYENDYEDYDDEHEYL